MLTRQTTARNAKIRTGVPSDDELILVDGDAPLVPAIIRITDPKLGH
jgi:hypothetical protein